jgi:hypothetical protein
MKSLLFKSAWNLVKLNKITFSEALTIAWKSYKNEVQIIVCESWNKIKRIAFTKNGTTSQFIENVINATKIIVNNECAAAYYNGSTFNND